MQYIPLEQIDGKTIKTACFLDFDEHFVIVFTDATYTHCFPMESYGCVSLESNSLTPLQFEEKAAQLGIFTETEITEAGALRDQENKRRDDIRDRREFERLSRKFAPR